MPKTWTAPDVSALAQAYQPACALAAAVELGLFDALADGPLTAEGLAERLRTDPRATRMLADALVALELLSNAGGEYAPARGVAGLLSEDGSHNLVAVVRHQAACVRRWGQLAETVRTGRPSEAPAPPGGALFAVNMLAHTDGGGTYTFAELREDLLAAEFDNPELLPRTESMYAIVRAGKSTGG